MTPVPEGSRYAVTITAGEAAELVGGRLEGDRDLLLEDVAPLAQAGPGELGLLAARRYLSDLSSTEAGALLVSEELAEEAARDDAPTTRVVVDDAHRALPALLERFHPAPDRPGGVHPTAVLGAGVSLGSGVCVGPYAVLEAGVEVGDDARIGAHAVVGEGSRVGSESVLHPHVVLYPGTRIGRRVVLHAGVRVGVDGYGYVQEDGTHRKVPQVGICVVEDDVEIGANCTLDRGSIGRTVVGRGSKLDNLVHVGHNVELGPRCLLVAQVGIAGSSRLGEGVVCGGQSGVGGHVEVGDGARISARGGAVRNVEAGATVSGFPARDHRTFLRGTARLMKLPDLERRVRELERAVSRSGDGEGAGPG